MNPRSERDVVMWSSSQVDRRQKCVSRTIHLNEAVKSTFGISLDRRRSGLAIPAEETDLDCRTAFFACHNRSEARLEKMDEADLVMRRLKLVKSELSSLQIWCKQAPISGARADNKCLLDKLRFWQVIALTGAKAR
ncbi:hypothetical protein [Rhizobium leguminosarum]|uniref:Uncharacterized protein n=1 Tax=Rhizobium leguminosarum TaxID=384 RepID=A0A2K9ZIT9_RHILE|nr:hypothetical protein [Rhizobium leguminosarum]AUW48129.1 hypothetical protein CUJ84_pRLN5000107 [Rhizobium leguminosarum]